MKQDALDVDGAKVLDISGAAGAWHRGYEAGQQAGSTFRCFIVGVVGFLLGMLTMGVLR